MIEFEGKTYRLEQRRAHPGELIQALIYVDREYPVGAIFRTHKVVTLTESIEILVYPTWYEVGMQCFGIAVFFEDADYDVMVEMEVDTDSIAKQCMNCTSFGRKDDVVPFCSLMSQVKTPEDTCEKHILKI
jgi:hypothetical protein